ncbi:MAG: beta-glucuronidase [Bacteroidales bacterium]|nr:beta-glucuronidase [Candidatus Liminaster caballi]
MTNLRCLVFSLLVSFALCDAWGTEICSTDVIDLSGVWRFSMGPSATLDDNISLPGSMLTNGKGDLVTVGTQWTGSLYDSSFYYNPRMEAYRHDGEMKFPFFLTPERHYVGTACYARTIDVPADWEGQPVTLYLERPHIETTVFVNGDSIGHQMSLSVPHQYDLTSHIRAGQSNEILIYIYNGIENVCVGQDSHSVTDQTQGNWNGIAGRIELQRRPLIYRKNVIPHLASHSVEIQINDTTYMIDMGKDAEPWDEFHPVLHTRTVVYRGMAIDVTFGMREIAIDHRQFLLNGHPIWMRGTVENCCFPETGYPPTDVESWMRVLGKCKEYGINHVRFHSYCPPDAAFTAADRLGIYLQPEGPSWPNHGVKLNSRMSIDKYLLSETKSIIDTYGHHPSLVMMAAGNEPAGGWVRYCNDWVSKMHDYDASRVYCGASVGGGWAWDDGSQYHVKGGARGLSWDDNAPQSADDYYRQILFPRNYKDSVPNQTPIIAHEQGQWCAFPDFKEIDQYTGAYKARNFEIFRDLLADNGMTQMAEPFLMASGMLQTLCYKYEIERNMRTADYAGFQLLGLNDYSGQGTALEGVLNVHWLEKGYCNADQWRQFCQPVVPLARFPKFVFGAGETLNVPVEVMNAGSGIISRAACTYSIAFADGSLLRRDTLCVKDIPVGKNIALGEVAVALTDITSPSKLTLRVDVDGSAFNTWDFWVYPQQKLSKTKGIYIANSLDEKAIKTLKRGGTVLIAAAGRVTLGKDVVQHYLPVFWNTSWFKMRPPHTTGAYIDQQHPLFAHGFPTDSWTNINWWELVNKAQVMNLLELPKDYQSPIQPIDTWHVSRKLGMMVEANVLNGRLLITTIDIESDLDSRLVARQMRNAIIDYMHSDDFRPSLTLDVETVSHFFNMETGPVNMFTNDSPDELKPKLP